MLQERHVQIRVQNPLLKLGHCIRIAVALKLGTNRDGVNFTQLERRTPGLSTGCPIGELLCGSTGAVMLKSVSNVLRFVLINYELTSS